MPFLRFGDALRAMWNGERVARVGWNRPGEFVAIRMPDEDSDMSRPFIYIDALTGTTPWIPSQEDLLAEDWMLV
jgi:hypothetical protein